MSQSIFFAMFLVAALALVFALILKRRTQELERQIQQKTSEISKIIGELGATQIKLFETG